MRRGRHADPSLPASGRRRRGQWTLRSHAIVTFGALAHEELHGDGAVTGTSAPHALPEFRGQPGGQRVTRSAKSLRTGIPIIQVDADRDTGHDDGVIAVVSTEGDGSRCR